MADQGSFDVVVDGSANVDRVVRVPSLPRPGETVSGADVVVHRGGKGANQAVAAARQGASVAFVGCLGDDRDGDWLRSGLDAEGIDTSHVVVSPGPTGQAFILVDDHGENCIALSPGADGRLSVSDIEPAHSAIESATVVLAQLEVPPEVVTSAMGMAHGRRILNPAPAVDVGPDLWAKVDLLIPNLGELTELSGLDASDRHDVVESAQRFDVDSVVVTLGDEGALIVRGDGHVHFPAPVVSPIDTTGAGDTFCGAGAASLARGRDLEDSVRWACVAAALSTTRLGAQTAMPTAAAVASESSWPRAE